MDFSPNCHRLVVVVVVLVVVAVEIILNKTEVKLKARIERLRKVAQIAKHLRRMNNFQVCFCF